MLLTRLACWSALFSRFPRCLGVIVPRLFPRWATRKGSTPRQSFNAAHDQLAVGTAAVLRALADPAEQLLALLADGGQPKRGSTMVRNVDEAIVRELKKRAARRNHSAEQEHREILEQALLRPRRRSLAEVLAAMPDAGENVDFERARSTGGRDDGVCTHALPRPQNCWCH